MKSKLKFFTGIMISIIIIFSSSILLYKHTLDGIKRDLEITTSEFKESQFKSIWLYIESLSTQSKREVTRISQEIEKDILALSDEDLYKIQEDMSNNVHNDLLHDIILSHIENQNLNEIKNHRNGIVIMSNDGYMEDYNYRRAVTVDGDHSFKTWDHSIENSFNEKLDENAYKKLINRTSGIIALESYDLAKNEDHIMITEMTYDSLLKVFLAEGIEGLRNYQIFVPYYITDFGDIFGQPDIDQGIKNDNNKIIVVQEFNIYDQVTNSHTVFDNKAVEDYTLRSEDTLRNMYLFGIILSITVCGLMLCCCAIYNKIVSDNEEANNELETENAENSIEESTK